MNKSFTFRAFLAVVAVVGVIDSTASAACWYPDEIVADQVKDFQYMLMVGALQCRNSGDLGSDGYNAFVAQKRAVLDAKGYVLKGHFLRENGLQGGRAAYDQNNTAMSNRHAGRSDDAGFCSTIAAYTRMAATSSDRDFVMLAESVVEPPASTCGAPARVAAVVPPPLPPALRRPEPAASPDFAVAAPDADDPYAAGREVIVPRGAAYAAGPVVEAAAYPERLPAAEAAYADGAADPRADARSEAQVDAAIVVDPDVIAPPRAVADARSDDADRPAATAYPAPPPLIHPVARTVAAKNALPTKVIAAAPVVAPDEAKAAQSPTAALQAAIAALQAATEALKAQQVAAGPTS